MTTWHPDELRTIAHSPVIHVSPKRAHGGDRPFTPIWAVALDGELYVRSHLDERIDAEYTTKYHGSAYLQPMLSPRTRAATLRVIPAA